MSEPEKTERQKIAGDICDFCNRQGMNPNECAVAIMFGIFDCKRLKMKRNEIVISGLDIIKDYKLED